ncbi:MAG: zf-TFIIB domain-containing protein [Chloroflexota bacterium]
MICPACHNPMIVVEYQQIELDYCTSCSGVWFDCGELELMFETMQMADDRKTCLPDSAGEAKTTEKKRKCPICGKRMKKRLVGKKPEILIDDCPQGEGLWFDGGEVDLLLAQLTRKEPAAQNTGEHIVSFLKDVFQARK